MNSHFKINYQDEIRRFSCQPDLALLETTIKSLLGLNGSVLALKYVDEDNDLCMISTPCELAYAVEHGGSPLRIQVTVQTTPPVKLQPELVGCTPTGKPGEKNLRQKSAKAKKALEHPLPVTTPEPTNEVQDPQAVLKQEIAILKAVLAAKRSALQQARKDRADKPKLQSLSQSLAETRKELQEKKHQKRTETPVPTAVSQPAQADLRAVVVTKRTALQEARKNGAPKPQIRALLEELACARQGLLANKTKMIVPLNRKKGPEALPADRAQERKAVQARKDATQERKAAVRKPAQERKAAVRKPAQERKAVQARKDAVQERKASRQKILVSVKR